MKRGFVMYDEIVKKIEEYDYIAIYRHVSPDYDAFGSQMGMYDLIKQTYPEKTVYVCGDFSSDLVTKFKVAACFDQVDYHLGVLGIVVDTANQERIDDQDYHLCKELIKIDHHLVVDSYGDINLEDSTASSASQLVCDLYQNTNLKLSVDGATALYMGIIGDSSRFLYQSTDERTFKAASALLETGIDISEIYDTMYLKKATELQINKFILNNYHVDGNIAYYILKDEDLKQLNISRERGSDYVNVLSGIEEYYIWMAITENKVDDNWRVSLRSRQYAVNQVAQKYNGGGHKLASGAKLTSLEQLDDLIVDLKELINEQN